MIRPVRKNTRANFEVNEEALAQYQQFLAQAETQNSEPDAEVQRGLEFSMGERARAVGDAVTTRFREIISAPPYSDQMFFGDEGRPELTLGPPQNIKEYARNVYSTLGAIYEGAEIGIRGGIAIPASVLAGLAEVVDQAYGSAPGEKGEGMSARIGRDMLGLLEVVGMMTGVGAGIKTATGFSRAEINKAILAARNSGARVTSSRVAPQPGVPIEVTRAVAEARYHNAIDDTIDSVLVQSGRMIGKGDLQRLPKTVDTTLRPESQAALVDLAELTMRAQGRNPTGVTTQNAGDIIFDMIQKGELKQWQVLNALEISGARGSDEFMKLMGVNMKVAADDIKTSIAPFDDTIIKVERSRPSPRLPQPAPDGSDNTPIMNIPQFIEETAQKYGGATSGSGATRFIHRMENRYRGALISQLATGVRNFATVQGRIGLDVLSRGLDRAYARAFFPDGRKAAEPIQAMGEYSRIFNPHMAGVTKAQTDELLARFPKMRDRVFGNLQADFITTEMGAPTIAGRAFDRGILLANTFNNASEKVVRRAIFATKIDSILKGRGVRGGIQEIVEKGGDVRNQDIAEAVDHTLRMVFAKEPELGSVAYHFVNLINKIPGAGFGIPFAKYMTNALETVNDFMPTGLLKLAKESERAKIREGDIGTISKVTVGAGVFGFAWALRRGQIPGFTPGPNWDEFLDKDGNVYSVKAFNPLVAPLFAADVAQRMVDGRALDLNFKKIAEGILGSAPQMSAATGLIDDALKALAGGSSRDFETAATNMADQIASGFLTPFRQLRDFGQEFELVDDHIRTARGTPMGRTIGAISYESLPLYESPTSAKYPRSPKVQLPFTLGEVSAGVIKQLTGLTVREPRNSIENEIEFLGIPGQDVRPKTGEPVADQLVSRQMGPMLEILGNTVINSPIYQNLGPKAGEERTAEETRQQRYLQQWVLRKTISFARQEAYKEAYRLNPEIKVLRKLVSMQLVEEAVINNLLKSFGTSTGLATEMILDALRGNLKFDNQ